MPKREMDAAFIVAQFTVLAGSDVPGWVFSSQHGWIGVAVAGPFIVLATLVWLLVRLKDVFPKTTDALDEWLAGLLKARSKR